MRNVSFSIMAGILFISGVLADDPLRPDSDVPIPSDVGEKLTPLPDSEETPREAKLRKLFEEFGFQLDDELPCVAEYSKLNEQSQDPIGLKITRVATRKWNDKRTKYLFGPKTAIRSREKLITTLQTSSCLQADIIDFSVVLPDGSPGTISFMRLEELQRQQQETVDVDIPFGFVGPTRPKPFIPK